MHDDYTSTKICSKCKREFPATTDYFIWHKRSQKLYNQCHECRREAKRQSHQRNREHNNERARRWYASNGDEVSRKRRESYAEHAEENRNRVLIWQKDNPEKANEKNRRWYWSDPEHARRLNREWGRRNPDKRRASSRKYSQKPRVKARRRMLERLVYATSPEFRAKQKAKAHRRRNAAGNFTQRDLRRTYAAQEGRCLYCGISLLEEYHADHVVPISRGGTNYPENIACACADCNLSKSNKLLHEWKQVRGW